MIGNSWDNYLKEEFEKPYFKELLSFVNEEYKQKTIYPPKNEVFNAFRYTKYENLKVVILGQDPYHGEREAQGLSFSVNNAIKRPPSLQNIFKELESDLQIKISEKNSLVPWAEQGVLLLNSVLTVIKDHPASHQKRGWETFTDHVIEIINEKETPVVFILWGNYARSKKSLITNKKHYIIESPHPSPFSAYNGFFGSKPFSKANDFLIKNNISPINWQI